jgi:uncharacterized protein
MPDFASFGLLAFAAGVFALGGFVKGVVGLGLPTIAMGLLSLRMAPAQAAALLLVPSLVTNLWQIRGPGAAALVRRMATLLLGVCLGVWAGAGWLTGAAGAHRGGSLAGAGLGLALTVYAALGLLRWRPRVAPAHEHPKDAALRRPSPAGIKESGRATFPWEALLAPLVGFATGLVTAATGVFVIPAVPYLQALGLAKDELVRALGISFLVSTIALGVVLGREGMLQANALAGSALALLPALAGMGVGQRLRRRVSAETFKTVFLSGLLALGVYLTIRAALQIV